MTKGLLIDYRYCTGCHTCEIACRQEHEFEPTKDGIKLNSIGPTPLPFGRYQYDYFPSPTDYCDSCGNRTSKGKKPSCVQHCQAGCIEYGDIQNLAPRITHEKMVLFTLNSTL